MLILALTFLLGGCAARKPARPAGGPVHHGEVVIPNDCIIDLKKTDETVCRGPDGTHIKCGPVTLTRKPGCELFDVSPKGEKK
jgi:hypothetical protein